MNTEALKLAIQHPHAKKEQIRKIVDSSPTEWEQIKLKHMAMSSHHVSSEEAYSHFQNNKHSYHDSHMTVKHAIKNPNLSGERIDDLANEWKNNHDSVISQYHIEDLSIHPNIKTETVDKLYLMGNRRLSPHIIENTPHKISTNALNKRISELPSESEESMMIRKELGKRNGTN